MAQFQSEIELRVKVLDKELADLEKRIAKVQGPITRKDADTRFRIRAEQQVLAEVKRLNVERIKSVNLNTSWYKALQQGKQIQLDINKAVAKEAQQRQRVTDALARQKKQQKSRRAQDILLGGGFPLLFGAGPGQAIAGALGGAVGGFGGGIAAQAGVAAISGLNNAIVETAKVTNSTAASFEFLTEKELYSSDEARRLADELAELGRVEELAALNTRELVNMIGNDGVNNLQALDTEWRELLSNIAELGLAIAGFISQFLKPVIELLNNAVGGINTQNRFRALQQDLAGTPQAEALAKDVAAVSGTRETKGSRKISDPLTVQEMDALLKKYSGDRPITAKVPVTDKDRKEFAPPKGGSGKSEEDRVRERLALLQAETEAIRRKSEIESKISQARIAEDQSLVNRLTLERELSTIREREEKALARVTDERLKQAISAKAIAEADAARSRFADREAERLATATQSYDRQIQTLELQLVAAEAVTAEERKQAELQLRLLQLRNANKNLTNEQLQNLEKLTKQIFAAQNQDPIQQYINQSQEALADTEAMIVSLAQSVEGAMASAIGTAVESLVTGSQTIEETLANMFKAIGKAFIQMAAEIIAKQLVMIALQAILKALGGATADTTGSHSLPDVPQSNAVAAGWPGNLNYSGGGFTGYGPRSGGVDGQGGFPAILHPNETVVDHTQPQSAQDMMARYSLSNTEGGAAGAMTSTINYTGPVLNFNGDDYIPRSEASSLVTAGAKQGEKRALNRLRQSRATRSKLGM